MNEAGPRHVAWMMLGLALITLVLYWPALDGEFLNWDDDSYVVENRAVHELGPSTVAWAFTRFHAYNWHPLTWLSHAVDYALYGTRPWGHHLTSVLLHALNGALLLWALWRLTGAAWPSAAAAGLFALHPLHVESVAWISERKDVLSTSFWILALLAYTAYARRPTARNYALVIAAFAAGLMSKPMLVTLPFVLLLLDAWPLNRLGRRAVIEKLPLIALSLASAVITAAAQKAGGAAASLVEVDLGTRLANAVVAYGRYLGKIVWPAELVHYYPYDPSLIANDLPALLASAVLLVLVTSAAWLLRRHRPYLPVGWLWYLGTLVPVIGLVQVGSQSMADRYTYVPLIGVFVAIAWAAWSRVTDPRGRAVYVLVFAALLVGCASRTATQIPVWKDSVRLWSHAVAAYPDNAEIRFKLGQALDNLGNDHYRRGDLEQAAELYARAIAIRPEQASAYAHLGAVRTRQGRLDEAVALLRQGLQHEPGHVETLNNLGVALAQSGDLEGAVQAWRAALEVDPDSPDARRNLARAHGITGDVD